MLEHISLITLLAATIWSEVVYLSGYTNVILQAKPSVLNDNKRHDLSETVIQSCHSVLKPTFDKLVFVLIDALRYDFAVNGKANTFFDEQENGYWLQLSVPAKARPPTVTMPRIKALVSGNCPGFISFVMNFASSEISDDNLIDQLISHGQRIVCFGDDTWMKLFPKRFSRYDGVTSFFVADYTEVDNNVTRHLPKELRETDWDVMILHYLGLDHIGHAYGSSSPLIKTKLEEFGIILRQTFQHLFNTERGNKTLVVIAGDHGMSDQGSHGGSSDLETLVPLIFVTKNSTDTHSNSTVHTHSTEMVEQVDLVPTLALLLGVPIPSASIGRVMNHILDRFLSLEQVLDFKCRNAAQLLLTVEQADSVTGEITEAVANCSLLHQSFLQSSYSHSYHEVNEAYDALLGSLQSILIRKSLAYNEPLMYLGIMSMFLSFVGLVLLIMAISYPTSKVRISQVFCYSLIQLSTMILTASAYFDYLNIDNYYYLVFGLPSATSSVLIFWILRQAYRKIHSIGPWSNAANPSTFFTLFVISATVVNKLSYASSSFIEEEHQVIYFIVMTSLCLLLLYSLHFDFTNSTVDPKISSYSRSLAALSLLTIFAFIKRLNRTGNKWLHLPDLKDWLTRPENTGIYLAAIFLCLVLVLILLALFFRSLEYGHIFFLFSTMALITVLVQKSCLLQITAPDYRSQKCVLEAQSIYAVIITFIFLSIVLKHCNLLVFRISWLLLGITLTKTHNTIVLSFLFVFSEIWAYLIRSLYFESSVRFDPFALFLVHYWLGKASFFAQGHSNSLASVDLAAGFVGVSVYNPIIISLLIAISTYWGPIYWLLICADLKTDLHRVCVGLSDLETKSWQKRTAFSFISYIVTTQTFSAMICLLVCLLTRYHLFVWSVFAPKLLYESADLVLVFILYLVYSLWCVFLS